jgi:hypothetical protein
MDHGAGAYAYIIRASLNFDISCNFLASVVLTPLMHISNVADMHLQDEMITS